MEIATISADFLQNQSDEGVEIKKFEIQEIILPKEMEVIEGEVSLENFVQVVIPNIDGSWRLPPHETKSVCTTQWQGENFVETNAGIFSLRDGEVDKKIMDANIKILRREQVISENSEKPVTTFLVCEVLVLWSGKISEIKVHENNFYNLFSEIRKKIPDLYLFNQNAEVWRQYLVEIYRRDIGQAVTKNIFERSGWHEINGTLTYDIGCDAFYQTVYLPPVEDNNAYTFEQAWNFLEVGKSGEVISAIWLLAHLAFSNYFFDKARCRFSSVLFVKGATGLLKTSAVKIVANPFDENRDNSTIRMTSTQASIANVMKLMSECLVIVDDFSNTELASKRKALENAEFVIRAVGDGIFPAKQEVKNFAKTVRESVTCTAILTGEDSLSLGRSSQLRIIEVEVNSETFDGRKLREFQKNPQIMSHYFSLFVKFLQENSATIVEYIHKKFFMYRDYFEEKFSIRRLSESTAILQIQIDILNDFARFCCQSHDRVIWQQQVLSQNLLSVITKNQKIGQKANPTLKFLNALLQTLNTEKAKIAENEEIFVNAEEKFVGFYEGNRLWIRPNDAIQIVQKYYRNLGENFLPSFDEMKKKLLIEGFSEGVLPKNGSGGEYVCRAKKGSRKRMLVLKMEVAEKALENFKEEF